LAAAASAAVHKGHDQDLGRDVAMKFLHDKYKDEPSILHRFVEEAQIGGQLQHPGIVPVYDLGMSDGKPFFTMKLVKGKTLAQALSDRQSVADDRRSFLAIFEQICQTMAYAHVRGVVHRDLKPANVMIGSFGEVQVVDWGMGKVLEAAA
jgi:serine/threonine protein kinase